MTTPESAADTSGYLPRPSRLREAVSVMLCALRLYRWQGWWDAGTDLRRWGRG